MVTWVNFLHIYQPPNQNKYVFEKVTDESYRKIVKFLNLYKNVAITMNVSGSLLEQLQFYEKDDVIQGIRNAAEDGKVELTGSAMFHPILPLLNKYEIVRQIELNNKISKKFFGDVYNPEGFFIPEMCYSKKVAEIVKSMGFEWIILDEISFNGRLDSIDCSVVYEIEDIKLKVLFRERRISNSFVPKSVFGMNKKNPNSKIVAVTATDGELYGHHHLNIEKCLDVIFSDRSIQSVKISDYIGRFESFQNVDPVNSCWESSENDLKEGVPYCFWKDPKNKLHGLIWKLAKFSIRQVENRKDDKNYYIARDFLDRGLASCTFWSASGRKSYVWKNIIWNPDMIETGALNLVRSVRSLRELDINYRTRAEKMFLDIVENIWHSHWEKYYKVVNCPKK